MKNHLLLSLSALMAVPAIAQSPTPRTAPRATWTLTTGVTGTPTQRRDNTGAASFDKMYLFGGRDGNANNTTHNALYEFNGTAWTLKTADSSAAGFPAPRGGACVAWNFTTNKLVVFGGDTGTGLPAGPVLTPTRLNDTWEWDPTTNAWTNVTPVTPSPSERRYSALTWDPNTGGMLLFGGETNATPANTVNDTWLFLGGVWVQLSPATVPPVTQKHSLVTRPEFNDILMCAGVDGGVTPNTLRLDVWRWNGGDWNLVPTAGTIPHAVTANQAVYDQRRQRIVLQGGQGLQTIDPVTYPLYTGSPSGWCSEFDSLTNTWTLYGAASATTNDTVIGRISRYFGAYVPALGKVYKVGGQNPAGVGTITGTCEYQANPIAAATSYGAGCAGPGGTLALASNNLPWTTRTWTGTCTGLGPTSLSLGVWGVATSSLPLAAVLPIAGPGCTLLNTADQLLGPDVPVAGAVTLSLPIPGSTALAGYTLHAQVAELEFDLAFNWVGLFTSNGVTLAIGAL